MSRVSIIIPCRNETYEVSPGVPVLLRTVQDIYEKATGDFEVIVAFDGPPYTPLPNFKNLKRLELPQRGTKPTLNVAASTATGKYLLKTDAHCMFSDGFDEALQYKMEDNWVVMPRFYVLNAEKWEWQDDRFYDYFRLPCPFTDPKMFRFQAGGHWPERTRDRISYAVDENMKLHGSLFFMSKDFYLDCLEGLSSAGSGTWSGEDIEISLKTWLGPWDGRVMVNKNAWYAHMHKGGQRPRGWRVSQSEINQSYLWTATYWMWNQWEGRAHDIDWLIDRFMPIPGWPDNWKELYTEWTRSDISLKNSVLT
jgi:glycosyltransferase involved in cell wall biosynthesis